MARSPEKIRRVIVLSAVIFLQIMLFSATAWLWSQPLRHQRYLASGFLQQHRGFIEVESLQPGAFGDIMLRGVTLGKSHEPLFKAKSGRIKFSKENYFSTRIPALEQIELDRAVLHIVQKKHRTTVNGMPLEIFLSELKNLPRAQGAFIPLTIKGTIKLNNQTPASDCTLKITYDDQLDAFEFACSWQSGQDKAVKGSWSCRIDQKNRLMTAATEGFLSSVFYQEMLRRSSVPARVSALLHNGTVSGKSKFSVIMPDMKISKLEVDGTIKNSSLRWYKQTFMPVDELAFQLKKDSRALSVNIPQLVIKKPFTLELGNINLHHTNGKNIVQASANCDLRQSAANFFYAAMNCPELKISAASDKIKARWDLQSGQWSIRGDSNSTAAENTVRLQNTPELSLVLTPVRFEFRANGTGNTGKVFQQLDFTDLQLQNKHGKFSSDQGSFFLTAHTGESSAITGDILEFNFGDFSADTPIGQFDLPGLAGAVNMRKLDANRRDLDIVMRGNSAAFIKGSQTVNSRSWSCNLALETAEELMTWKVNNLVIQTPYLEYICPEKGKLQLEELFLSGEGGVEQGNITRGEIKLKTALARHSMATLKQGELRLKYSPEAERDQRFALTCQGGEILFTKPYFPIKSAEAFELVTSTGDFYTKPKALRFSAVRLEVMQQPYELRLFDSRLDISRSRDHNWSGEIKFASLQADPSEQTYPRSTFGSGSAKLNWQYEYGFLKKTEVAAAVQAPSWSWGELQCGGESARLKIAVEPDGNTKHFSNLIEIKKANVISPAFTAEAPDMSINLSCGDQLLKGMVKFKGGTVASPDSQLQLFDTDLELPLHGAKERPSLLQAGRFSSRKVVFKKAEEGAFSGKLEHFLQFADRNSLADHTLRLNGVLNAVKFNGAPVNISVSCQLPPAATRGECRLEMPESKLTVPAKLNNYLPLPWDATLLKGNIALDLLFKFNGSNAPDGSMEISCANSDWQIGAVTVNGATGKFKGQLNNGRISFAPADVLSEKILWQNWALADNQLQIALTQDQKLQLNRWQGSFMESKFELESPFITDAENTSNKTMLRFRFKVKDLHSGSFFRLLKIDYISSDMLLAGSLQICCDLTNNKIYFEPSKLKSSGKKSALLKITPPDENMLKTADRSYRDFTLAVIKSMYCSQAAFDFAMQPGEVTIKITAEGAPERPVPFVYQGSRAAQVFRPAELGEEGFSGVLELNVNLKLHPEDPGI